MSDTALRTAELKLLDLLADVLRRDYLDPDAATFRLSEACTLTGHRPKIDKPYERKTDWQRGCVCGRQPYA